MLHGVSRAERHHVARSSTRPRTLACPAPWRPPDPMEPVRRAPSVVVAAIPALVERWKDHCIAAARAARAERGRYALAVPGGSVAEHFLPALASADMDWPRVALFFCDERCVPPDQPDSNFA